ncbi:MAG: carbamoyltransferase HypF [Verrucomicrobia bacterium]|nr:carbamoyltransferase HypF [Verrucomicrobiota bacterium]
MTTPTASESIRLRICVRGAVQGVGFRPFVYRLATELGMTGSVKNSSQGVVLEAEGPRIALERFLLRIEAEKPPRSSIQSLEASWLDPVGYTAFEISESDGGGEKSALVLPDIAVCPDCLRELFDPSNRRYRYPFTNCTHCGPRFSIIEALPYDRANTSMKSFAMCPQCRTEYEDPRDRRFHAQPNACPVCGPHLELWDKAGTVLAGGICEPRAGFQPAQDNQVFLPPGPHSSSPHPSHEALLAAAEAIRQGQIVAVKGLGGFHLIIPAHDDQAVRRLRERKHREEKPFALMFPSLEMVKAHCEVSEPEQRLLCSPEAPIVLLRRNRTGSGHATSSLKSQFSNSVAPGNPHLGVMLPYTPLHHLLMAELGFPIVATSGNLSDEPICTDEREALERLSGLADLFLVHNRPIIRHVDDSIVRVVLDRELVLRRARGFAPLPISLKSAIRNPQSEIVLAVGAHLKNTVALSVGGQVFLSQHIGDLETEQALDAFRRTIADFERLYEAKPSAIAADLHPDYLSTKFAQQETGRASLPSHEASFCSRRGDEADVVAMTEIRLLTSAATVHGSEAHPKDLAAASAQAGSPRYVGVQHHIAHVLSCMAENEVGPPVLGVSWDGTGYGLDGTVWGGEFFLVTDRAIERVAHLRPFPLPGGDQAVREPRRSALGLLFEMFGDAVFENFEWVPLRAFSATELSVLKSLLPRRLNCPLTSSAGRLFDAVASLVGLRQITRYEGQAAMELEFSLEGVRDDEAYPWRIAGHEWLNKTASQAEWPSPITHRPSPIVLDWAPTIQAIQADLKRDARVGTISARFHNALADAIVAVAQRLGERRVVLTGGCFQNRYLTERAVQRLREEGFRPYWHQRVPPNDGGIALGQVAFAQLHARISLTVPASASP